MREQVVRDEFRGLKSKFATMVATIIQVRQLGGDCEHGVPHRLSK